MSETPNFINSDTKIETYLSKRKKMINRNLNSMLPKVHNHALKKLDEAMRYGLFAGGKRIRPILSIAIYEYSGGKVKDVIIPACCVEFFHTSSLMIDDLPFMDNASFRRGKLATHKKFGSQITMLAAVSLAAKGFEILAKELSKSNISAPFTGMLIEMSAKMIGLEGASGGQFFDLNSKPVSESDILQIYKKTSSLFYLSGLISAEIGRLSEDEKHFVMEYVRNVGLLFQLVDDLLDVDLDRKYNFARLFGEERIKVKIHDERIQALRNLEQLDGDTSYLKSIVNYIVSRCKQ